MTSRYRALRAVAASAFLVAAAAPVLADPPRDPSTPPAAVAHTGLSPMIATPKVQQVAMPARDASAPHTGPSPMMATPKVRPVAVLPKHLPKHQVAAAHATPNPTVATQKPEQAAAAPMDQPTAKGQPQKLTP